MKKILKPAASDFQSNEPMFASLVPNDGLLLQHLEANAKSTCQFLGSLPEEKLLYRYAPGKWTIKETVMHLVEMERIYTYRALCFARNEKQELPGFDAESYILHSGANERGMEDLLEEFTAVRRATILLADGLPAAALANFGTMNGYRVSVAALLYHIAGHELHHLQIIRERYLGNSEPGS